MPGCFSKSRPIKRYELTFLTLCENVSTYDPEQMRKKLDNVWDSGKHELSQIAMAGDESKNNALHTCASLGNVTVLEWYYKKMEENKGRVRDWLDVNKPNAEGYTPLFLACLYGKT